MAMRDSVQVVELVRHIRHDYLNHFQVISGYLELGMPERAQAYINDLLADAQRERELLSLQSQELGLVLYQIYMHWRVQGLILKYSGTDIIDEWAVACLPTEIEKLIMSQGWRAPVDDDLILELKCEEVSSGQVRLTLNNPAAGTGAETYITRE